MNKDEFRARLEQVAELKDRKPIKSANHRAAIEYITEVDEFGEEYQMPVEITDNPTLGFDLVKIKDQHRSCELGCGDIIPNQIIEQRYCETPLPHWRTRCNTCKRYVSPDGEGFVSGGHAVQVAYTQYFRVEGCEKPKPKPICAVPNPTNQPCSETVTNDGIIRRYK
jgi:hypothetical protein